MAHWPIRRSYFSHANRRAPRGVLCHIPARINNGHIKSGPTARLPDRSDISAVALDTHGWLGRILIGITKVNDRYDPKFKSRHVLALLLMSCDCN